jgi:hypothetical protein
MTYEIVDKNNDGNPYVRAEDDNWVYIVTFDRYYPETIVDMRVIHKRSAERKAPTLQHYFNFGQLHERYRLFNTLKAEHA